MVAPDEDGQHGSHELPAVVLVERPLRKRGRGGGGDTQNTHMRGINNNGSILFSAEAYVTSRRPPPRDEASEHIAPRHRDISLVYFAKYMFLQ